MIPWVRYGEKYITKKIYISFYCNEGNILNDDHDIQYKLHNNVVWLGTQI